MDNTRNGMELLGMTPAAREVVRFLEDSSIEYLSAHTSGSTGCPKPILLPRDEVLKSAEATNRFFGITDDSVLVCPLSADYIAGKMMIVRAWMANCRLTMLPPSNNPLREFSGAGITLLPIVPSMTEGLLTNLSTNIEHVIVGGAAPTPAQEKALAIAPFHAWATYGMTETCSHVALRDISAGEEFFNALPGVTCSQDERGCLIINGRIVTNDVVELLSPTRFIWKGRADNVIVSGGLKIHPEELESTLRPHIPDQVEFYITSRPSEKWGREAVIVLCNDLMEAEELLSIVQSVLPHKYAPKAVLRLSPEYTPSGKLIRHTF